MVQSFSAVVSVASSPRHWTIPPFFFSPSWTDWRQRPLGTHGEPTDPYRFLEPKTNPNTYSQENGIDLDIYNYIIVYYSISYLYIYYIYREKEIHSN